MSRDVKLRPCMEACEARTLLSAGPWKACPPPAVHNDPRVYAPHSTVRGQTLEEWSEQWWQWVLSFPEDTTNNDPPDPVYENPFFDTDGSLGHLGDVGKVFFLPGLIDLAGDPAHQAVTREIDVPTGTPIFFPAVNVEWSVAEGMADPVAAVAESMTQITTAYAKLDKVAISDLTSRTEPTGLFTIDFPVGNIYGVAPGPSEAASDGYWVMLKPLSPGRHKLSFGGSFGPDFTIDITYKLNVVPKGHYRHDAHAAPLPANVAAANRFSVVRVSDDLLGNTGRSGVLR